MQTGKKDVNQGNPNGKYYFFTCASEPLRSDDYIFDGESILLPGNGANVGLVLYYNGKFDLYQRTYALTNFFINGKYLYFYFLANWKNSLIDKQYGSATNYIRLGNITEFSVPIAPLNEQKRIVAKLEKLLAKVNDSCDRLSRIPSILKRFRQSILASACSGRLTADWRKSHPDIEPAEELLKRIQEERIKSYEEECAKAKAEGRRKPPSPKSSEIVDYDVDTWKITTLESVAVNIVDCPHSTPKWSNNGLICVRTTNFLPFKLNLEDVKYVSYETYLDRISRLKPQEGDILYSREGGILGIACQIPKDTEICLGQRMMLIRCSSELFDDRYMTILLNSEIVLSQVRNLITGTASPHLNVGDVKKYTITIPPLEEQKEIVKRVEALFRKCDLIEQRYLKAKTYTDKLTQSILAKAFRGELVPQDPNDEPAEILLERIREEKALTEKSKKGKKTSKRKTT
ncbi:MAG: restriction endonuclease subunit S [Cyanobacterium sp.]